MHVSSVSAVSRFVHATYLYMDTLPLNLHNVRSYCILVAKSHSPPPPPQSPIGQCLNFSLTYFDVREEFVLTKRLKFWFAGEYNLSFQDQNFCSQSNSTNKQGIYRVSQKKFPLLKIHSIRSFSRIRMIQVLVKSQKIEMFGNVDEFNFTKMFWFQGD